MCENCCKMGCKYRYEDKDNFLIPEQFNLLYNDYASLECTRKQPDGGE